MSELETFDLIYLTYITDYDIGLMYEALENNLDRNAVLTYASQAKKLDAKKMNLAIDKTRYSLQKLRYHRIKAVSIFDDSYPKSLKAIKDAPPVLYVKGDLRETKNAAVVGSRAISDYAENNTKNVVDWLNDKGYSIISGLAEGIDTLAHRSALDNKQYTIAVLPNSLDSIYPKTNYGLAADILNAKGCLVSETIFNVNRGKRSFVQRNRIQAALSEVVIPIEMGVNSGTTHTINFAKRYDKSILVSKIKKEWNTLEQYSGIQSLLSNRSKNMIVYDDEKSFKKGLIKSDSEQTRMEF